MSKPLRILPYLLFIVSGAWGLVYEVTWARYLSLFLGNTTLAHMCVLAGFMGGLALGSFLIGAATRRFRRPLAIYGWLEVAIGIYAVIFPFIIRPLQSLALQATPSAEFGSPVALTVKLLVAVGALILPTFLMGGTFPTLMRHFQPESEQQDDKSEWLYLANCGGAVGGTLLAGFLLIPSLGMRMTLTSVGAANLALGLVAVMLGFTCAASECPEAHRSRQTARHALAVPVYAAIAVSGATAMIYELIWIRMFSITLGSSTYSFTLMLAAFISGIALGSLAVGVLRGARATPILGFAAAETAIGFAIIASIPIYDKLPYVFWRWSSLLRPAENSFALHSLLKYSLCFGVMLVPTFFFGMTLPLAIKTVAHHDETIGRDAGYVYGANTAGTLVGVLLAGLVLLPMAGLRHSLEIALMANLAAGAVLIWLSGLRWRAPVAVVCCAAAVALVLLLPKWHPVALAGGTFRMRSIAPPTWKAYEKVLAKIKLRYAGEDGSARVTVVDEPGMNNGKIEQVLIINGKPDGSSWGDMVTQVLLAQIPMLFKPDSRDALVIGLGTGATAGSVLTHPETRVDCVEISPAVARALPYFDQVNGRVRENPRFNLIIEDARTVTAVARKKYDVVISEPTNPWVAGVGNLFSLEFFQSLDRTLEPGGVVAQWFHSYEMSDELAAVILRTVRQVFPYVYVFESGTNDYILLASREPITPDFAAMERRMRLEAVRQDLARISLNTPAAFLARHVMSPETAAEVSGDGPVNCDDLPILEYSAPRAQYANDFAQCFRENDERRWGGEDLFSVQYIKARRGKPGREDYRSLIRMCLDPRMNQKPLLLALLKYYLARWPDDAEMLMEYAQETGSTEPLAALRAAYAAVELKPSARSIELEADVLLTELMRGQTVFTPQDFKPVIELLDRAIKLDPTDQALQEKRGHVASMVQ